MHQSLGPRLAATGAKCHLPAMTLEDLILFVDGEAIVIDKPAGLPVDQPRAGGTSIEARIGELTLGFAGGFFELVGLCCLPFGHPAILSGAPTRRND